MPKQPPPFDHWLRRHMDNAAMRAADLSRDTGIAETNISRWLRGIQVPDLDNARKLARGLGRPVLEVLVVAGHLTPQEAGLHDIAAPAAVEHQRTSEGRIVATLTDKADPKTRRLVAEMVRRLTGTDQ